MHYTKLNGKAVAFSCCCNHSDLENNTCPTRKGNCEECEFCIVELNAEDFWHIWHTAEEAESAKKLLVDTWNKSLTYDQIKYILYNFFDGNDYIDGQQIANDILEDFQFAFENMENGKLPEYNSGDYEKYSFVRKMK